MQRISATAPLLCITLAGGLFHAAAAAQAPVYRCGNTYSERPCEGAAPLSLQDTRTPEQQAAASAATQRMGRHAEELAKERVALEKKAQREPTIIGRATVPATPKTTPATRKPKGSKNRPEYFTASTRDATSGQRKARKQSPPETE